MKICQLQPDIPFESVLTRVNVVSEAFAGKSTMQRHRLIYGALSKDFEAGLHALSLNTKTPAEVAKASEA